MRFELTSDQVDLVDGVRKLTQGRFPVSRVRQLADAPGAVDRPLWRELVEFGLFSLRVPEADGGSGLGLADAVLAFEVLGHALVPGPLVATHLAPSAGVRDEVVGAIDATTSPLVVEHLDALDTIVVVASDGLRAIEPGALDTTELVATDPLTAVHRVDRLPDGGDALGGPDAAAQWRIESECLTAALLLGIAQTALDMSVAYAKERQQFGRPIGSFQAVKHMLADMLVRTELARSSVYAAAVTVDDPEVGDPARAVAGAKLLAGRAATTNGSEGVQVHGGMGFTWEVDVHLALKRAWVLDAAWGNEDAHAESVAARLV